MHEEATKLHHLLADGLNTGAFLVQVQNKLVFFPSLSNLLEIPCLSTFQNTKKKVENVMCS